MTTTTQWADLPNAAHIDRVIASLNSNFKLWTATGVAWSVVEDVAITAARDLLIKQGRYSVWLESREAVWNAVRDAARDVAQNAVRDAARDVVWDRVWDAVWEAGYDVLLALIAYGDCAYMLDSDPGEIAILAKLGDCRAGLLLPACKAFHSLKELV